MQNNQPSHPLMPGAIANRDEEEKQSKKQNFELIQKKDEPKMLPSQTQSNKIYIISDNKAS